MYEHNIPYFGIVWVCNVPSLILRNAPNEKRKQFRMQLKIKIPIIDLTHGQESNQKGATMRLKRIPREGNRNCA